MSAGKVSELRVDIAKTYELLKKYNISVENAGASHNATKEAIEEHVGGLRDLIKSLKKIEQMDISDDILKQQVAWNKDSESLLNYINRMNKLSGLYDILEKSMKALSTAKDKLDFSKITKILNNELKTAEINSAQSIEKIITQLQRLGLINIDLLNPEELASIKAQFAKLGSIFKGGIETTIYKEAGGEQAARDITRKLANLPTDAQVGEAKTKIREITSVLLKEIVESRAKLSQAAEDVEPNSGMLRTFASSAFGSEKGIKLDATVKSYENVKSERLAAEKAYSSTNYKVDDKEDLDRKIAKEHEIEELAKREYALAGRAKELNKEINDSFKKRIEAKKVINDYESLGLRYNNEYKTLVSSTDAELEKEVNRLKKIITQTNKITEINEKAKLGIEKINFEVSKLSIKYKEAIGKTNVSEDSGYTKNFKKTADELNKVSIKLEEYKKKAASLTSASSPKDVESINLGIVNQTANYEKLLANLKITNAEEIKRINTQDAINQKLQRAKELYKQLGFGNSSEKQSYDTDESYLKRLTLEGNAAERLLEIRRKINNQKKTPVSESEKNMAFELTIDQEHSDLLEKRRELEIKLGATKKKNNNLSDKEKKKVQEIVNLKKEVAKLSHEYNVSEGKALGTLGRMAQGYKSIAKTFGERFKFILTAGIAYKAQNLFISSIKDSLSKTLELERQIAEIGTLEIIIRDELARKLLDYKNGIIGLSEKYGEETSKLTKALYDIRSATIESSKAMDVLETVTKAGKASLTDAASAAKPIIAILNAYNMDASEANHVSDMLFATIQRGVTTMKELAPNIGKAIAAAAMVGVDAPQVLAMISSTTRMGVSTRETITAVNRLLLNFSKRTKRATSIARKYGFSLADIKDKSKGLVYVFNQMQKATDAEKIALVGSIRAFKAMAAGIIDVKGQMFDVEYIRNSEGKTDEALAKIQKTVAFRVDKMKQTINAALLQVGETLIPLLEKILAMGEDLEASGIYDRVKEAIITISSLLTAFVTTNIIKTIILQIGSMATAIKGLGIASEATAVKVSFSMGIIGAAVTAATFLIVRSYMRRKAAELELRKAIDLGHSKDGSFASDAIKRNDQKKKEYLSIIALTKRYKELNSITNKTEDETKQYTSVLDKLKSSYDKTDLPMKEHIRNLEDVEATAIAASLGIDKLNKSNLAIKKNEREGVREEILERAKRNKADAKFGAMFYFPEGPGYDQDSANIDITGEKFTKKDKKYAIYMGKVNEFVNTYIESVKQKGSGEDFLKEMTDEYNKVNMFINELYSKESELSDSENIDENGREAVTKFIDAMKKLSERYKPFYGSAKDLDIVNKDIDLIVKEQNKLKAIKKDEEGNVVISEADKISFSPEDEAKIISDINAFSKTAESSVNAAKDKTKKALMKILDASFQLEMDESDPGKVKFGEDGLPSLAKGVYTDESKIPFNNAIAAYKDEIELIEKKEKLRKNNLELGVEEKRVAIGLVDDTTNYNQLLENNVAIKKRIAELSGNENTFSEETLDKEKEKKVLSAKILAEKRSLNTLLKDDVTGFNNKQKEERNIEIDAAVKLLVDDTKSLEALSGKVSEREDEENKLAIALFKKSHKIALSKNDFDALGLEIVRLKAENDRLNRENVQSNIGDLSKLSTEDLFKYQRYYKDKNRSKDQEATYGAVTEELKTRPDEEKREKKTQAFREKMNELNEKNKEIAQEEALISNGLVDSSGKLLKLDKERKVIFDELMGRPKESSLNDELSDQEKIELRLLEIEEKRKLLSSKLIGHRKELINLIDEKNGSENGVFTGEGSIFEGKTNTIIENIAETELKLREMSGEYIENRESEKAYLVAIEKQKNNMILAEIDLNALADKKIQLLEKEKKLNCQNVTILLEAKRISEASRKELHDAIKTYKEMPDPTEDQKKKKNSLIREENKRSAMNILGIPQYKNATEARLAVEDQANQVIMQGVDFVLDYKLRALEKEKQAKLDQIEDDLDSQKEAVSSEIMTATHRANAMAHLEKDAQKKRDKLEKAYAKKEAKAQKEKAIYQVVIDTARGIMAQVATGKLWMIPIVAALGAAQIALVNNTKFASGGYTGNGTNHVDETGKKQAGIVHEKEFVMNESATDGNVSIFYKMQKDLSGGLTFTQFAMNHLLGKYDNISLPNASPSGYYANGGYAGQANVSTQSDSALISILETQNQMFSIMNARLENIERYNNETSFNTDKMRRKGRGI